MPKLLQVSTEEYHLRVFLLPLARHFRALGWRVDGLAKGIASSEPCTAAFDHTWEAAWSRDPARALAGAAPVIRHLRALVARERYDLVHVHTPVAAFLTRFALRDLPGRPRVVYTAHGFHFHAGGRPLPNFLFRTLERLAGRWTDALLVINREDEAAAKRHGIVPPERVRYVPGVGIDLERYAPERVGPGEVERLRRALGLGAADPLFVMAAEFNPGKRHRDALRAFARLERPGAHLALAGTGRLLEATRRLAAGLGVADRVHFLGFRDDVPVLLRAARAALLPSEREGLPRSVMEAMSLEVPVVGADARGVRELVGPECGVLVPVGDVDGLARALRRLADDPEEAQAMGRRGRARLAPFGLERVLALHEALYAELLTAG